MHTAPKTLQNEMVMHLREIKNRLQQLPHAERTINQSAATQMTLVLLEKGLVLEGSTPKIVDKEVPGIYIQDFMIPSSNNL